MSSDPKIKRARLVRIGEAARMLEMSLDALRRWADEGKIQAVIMPSGHRFFKVKDINAILRGERK